MFFLEQDLADLSIVVVGMMVCLLGELESLYFFQLSLKFPNLNGSLRDMPIIQAALVLLMSWHA